MPDYIPREILKKKALDRWENEGGRISLDRLAINTSSRSRVQLAADRAPARTEIGENLEIKYEAEHLTINGKVALLSREK